MNRPKNILNRGASLLLGLAVLATACGKKRESAHAAPPVNDGSPQTLAELDAWYAEPPAGQNGAGVFAQGFALLKSANANAANLPLLGKGTLPPPGSPLPAAMKSAVAQLLEMNRDALQILARGAKAWQWRYPIDLTQGQDTILPHLGGVRNGVKIEVLSAMLAAENKNGRRAGTNFLTALALARSLEQEPLFASQLMRVGDVFVALPGLEQVLNRTSLPDDILRDLLGTFQKMEAFEAGGEGFNRALVGERLGMDAALANPQKMLELLPVNGSHLPEETRSQIVERLQKGGELKEEKQFHDDSIRELLMLRKAGFPERLKAADAMLRRQAKARERKLAIVVWIGEGLDVMTAKEARSLASIRLGLTAVALERFRAARSNQYPNTLSELSPDFLPLTPADPFDGSALRYKRRAGGYMLYSIGPDLKDDLGESMKEGKGDLAFTVIAPPRLDVQPGSH